METNNYTLGRGELHFGQFKTGTQTPRGERYLGNTPEFSLTISAENLDHFSSDEGVREKDQSIAVQTNRSGALTTDNINADNVALFFFGEKLDLAIAAATVAAEAIADVEKGLTYQLGVSDTHPSGARGLDLFATGPDVNVEVKKGATTLVEGTDYTIDMALARLTILEAGSLIDGDDITVGYKVKAQSRERIISGSQAVEGSLRFIAKNPVGAIIDYFMPWVKVTPNGDYSLKGEDWQQIPFNIEVLKKTGLEAVYADGRPVFS